MCTVQALVAGWRPCGMLSDGDQSRVMAVVVDLLRHLAAHGERWQLKGNAMDSCAPSSSSMTQALMQLLLRLTRKHANAAQVGTRKCFPSPPA